MRTGLFYDTETTGLPLFNDPSEDPRQPHLVQLAASLIDLDKRETIASMNVIVEPRGWVIPDDVAKIHGITTEHAAAFGVSEHLALMMFTDLWLRAQRRIAHNESQYDRPEMIDRNPANSAGFHRSCRATYERERQRRKRSN